MLTIAGTDWANVETVELVTNSRTATNRKRLFGENSRCNFMWLLRSPFKFFVANQLLGDDGPGVAKAWCESVPAAPQIRLRVRTCGGGMPQGSADASHLTLHSAPPRGTSQGKVLVSSKSCPHQPFHLVLNVNLAALLKLSATSSALTENT